MEIKISDEARIEVLEDQVAENTAIVKELEDKCKHLHKLCKGIAIELQLQLGFNQATLEQVERIFYIIGEK